MPAIVAWPRTTTTTYQAAHCRLYLRQLVLNCALRANNVELAIDPDAIDPNRQAPVWIKRPRTISEHILYPRTDVKNIYTISLLSSASNKLQAEEGEAWTKDRYLRCCDLQLAFCFLQSCGLDLRMPAVHAIFSFFVAWGIMALVYIRGRSNCVGRKLRKSGNVRSSILSHPMSLSVCTLHWLSLAGSRKAQTEIRDGGLR